MLEFSRNTDENQNCGLSSPETDDLENVGVSEKNRGGKNIIHQSLCPYYRFLYNLVKEQYNEGLFHDFWVTNGTIRIKEYEYSKPMDITHTQASKCNPTVHESI